jgi:hypothetical protein
MVGAWSLHGVIIKAYKIWSENVKGRNDLGAHVWENDLKVELG